MDFSWINQSPYLAAFMVGLLGGVHCLGMCGGLISAVGFTRQANLNRLPILISYNFGRILSYTSAGALAGGLGATLFSLSGIHAVQNVLYALAALFMLALGLYLAGLWRGVAQLESLGARLWKYLEPISRRFIPIQTPLQALPFGLIWGWLPCGLVYSVLIWSLSAGSIQQGALLMLAFGLGTLPNLLLMGAAASRLNSFTRKPSVRLSAGLLVCALGLVMLWNLWKTAI